MNIQKLSSIVEDVVEADKTCAIIVIQETYMETVYDIEIFSPSDGILSLKTFEAINPNWRKDLSAEIVCTTDNSLIFVQIGDFSASGFEKRQLQNLRAIYPLAKTEENLAKFPQVIEFLSKLFSD